MKKKRLKLPSKPIRLLPMKPLRLAQPPTHEDKKAPKLPKDLLKNQQKLLELLEEEEREHKTYHLMI